MAELYGALDTEHQADVEPRFLRCQPAANLASFGVDALRSTHVPACYGDICGGKRGAYHEARIYAEPTAMLSDSGLRGADMAEGHTSYPTSMPGLVEVRMRRRGSGDAAGMR